MIVMMMVLVVVLLVVLCWPGGSWGGRVALVGLAGQQAGSSPPLLLGLEGGPGGRGRLGPGGHYAVTGHCPGGHCVVQGEVGGALLDLGVLGVSG